MAEWALASFTYNSFFRVSMEAMPYTAVHVSCACFLVSSENGVRLSLPALLSALTMDSVSIASYGRHVLCARHEVLVSLC